MEECTEVKSAGHWLGSSVNWKHRIIAFKWRFDVGRSVMQSYINPVVRTVGFVAGAILTARAGTNATAAWIAAQPLWIGGALAGLYFVTCFSIGCVWIDLAKILRRESEVTLQANAPLQEVLERSRRIEAHLAQAL